MYPKGFGNDFREEYRSKKDMFETFLRSNDQQENAMTRDELQKISLTVCNTIYTSVIGSSVQSFQVVCCIYLCLHGAEITLSIYTHTYAETHTIAHTITCAQRTHAPMFHFSGKRVPVYLFHMKLARRVITDILLKTALNNSSHRFITFF